MNGATMDDFPKAPTVTSTGIIRTSDQVELLFAALSAAQGEMRDPPKSKVAKVESQKRSYSYKYADLADLLKIIRPIFAKHGLGIVQPPANPNRGCVVIVTRVFHTSGQWLETDLTMLVGDDRPQTLGSAITYGRRYAVAGVANMAPDDDEDGQAAQDAADEDQSSPTFDPYNESHRAILKQELIHRGVPDKYHRAVLAAMPGKTQDELPSVLDAIREADRANQGPAT
jgi:hypothetical protein